MVSHTQEVILILTGFFGFAAIFVIAVRLMMRKIRKQALDLSDYLSMIAFACILSRTASTTVVVLWHNNNDMKQTEFTAQEIYQRETGSKITFSNRLIYNTYLWIQKSVVLLLYSRIFSILLFAERVIKAYWVALFASYVAVQVACFLDCHPLHLYWQVVPNPGECTHAQIQLFTFVSLNIATDVLLLIFPIPLIFTLKQSTWKSRLQLLGLFSIGIILIVIAFVRLPVYHQSTSQVRRYTWGSVEEFGAALVANLPTIYSLRRKKFQDKNNFRPPPDVPNYTRSKRSTSHGGVSEDELVDWPPTSVQSRHGSCDHHVRDDRESL